VDFILAKASIELIECGTQNLNGQKIRCLIITNGAKNYRIGIPDIANDSNDPNDQKAEFEYSILQTYYTSAGMYNPIRCSISDRFFAVLYEGAHPGPDADGQHYQMVAVYLLDRPYVWEARTVPVDHLITNLLLMGDYRDNLFLFQPTKPLAITEFNLQPMELLVYTANKIEGLELLLDGQESTKLSVIITN
jgi:hypothetical protein